MKVRKNGFFKRLGQFLKKAYFQLLWSPNVNTQPSFLKETTLGPVKPSGTMCEINGGTYMLEMRCDSEEGGFIVNSVTYVEVMSWRSEELSI